MRKKKIFFLLPVFAGLLLAPAFAVAAGSTIVEITPAIIDEKGKPRDIFKESITITNTSDHKVELYPAVNNVDPTEGQQGFSPAQTAQDRTDSLANWIELSRGVIELGPGEKRTVDFIIRINLNAVPGEYHALISFAEGWSRPDAESRPPAGPVAVNLEVESDSREVMQLNKFTSDNMVFTGDDVLFKYQVQNIGNQQLQPTGEIRIYDRKGTEVAAIDVNKEGKSVSPDQTAQLASVWSAVRGFGKFKALLTVNYGKGQTAAVQDTVYFWIIPWKQLLVLFAGTLTAVVILIFYFRRWFEERHLGQLAHAGLLKAEAVMHIHHVPEAEVATVTPEKKGKSLFSFFSRRTAAALEAPSQVPNAAVPREKKVSIPAPRGLRDAFDRSTVDVSSPSGGLGSTIDLKQLHVVKRSGTESPASSSAPISSRGPIVETQGSVIDLRRRNQ